MVSFIHHMLKHQKSCLQCTTMKKFIHLQNFKDNLEQGQLKYVLKFANIRLQNINTTMLVSRSCTPQKRINNFKAIPHRKKDSYACLYKRLSSNYPLNIKMNDEQIINELLQAFPHTTNSRVSVRYYTI